MYYLIPFEFRWFEWLINWQDCAEQLAGVGKVIAHFTRCGEG